MASKEITTFIVDLSPSMANKSNGRNISDLEYGLKYFYDIVTSKILRGRKTDYISVITCHSNKTDNPFANEDSFKNIEVVSNKIAPTYDDLQRYNEVLRPNMTEIDEEEGDCFESMLVGIGLLKDTHRLKFIRNVVVITNAETNIKSFETKVADATRNAINEMNVNVVLNGIDFDVNGLKYPQKSPEKARNESDWISVFDTYKTSKVYTTAQIVESILHNPPLKKVRPMRVFKGQLRFGSDHINKENSDYSPELDPTCISLNVELYPALKAEKLPSGHQYKIDRENNSVDIIKYSKNYFIKLSSSKDKADDGDDDEVHKRQVDDDEESAGDLKSVSINADEWTDGFKYSNYDLLTLDQDLLNSAKLASSPGMDILGFIKIEDLPYAYLTGESYYLLPESSCSYKNIVGFNGLCQSLIDLEGVAIVRYVQKINDEISVCALIPSRIRVSSRFVYAFILIRLPFKEDEKIGKFPMLTSIKTTSGKSYTLNDDLQDDNQIKEEQDEESFRDMNLPNTTTNELMESFILSKDLDKELESSRPDKFFVENNKVALFNDSLISFASLSNFGVSSRLMVSSPAIHKFNLNIKKIIIESLKHRNLHEYLSNPNFVQDNLISNKNDSSVSSTNLFNLSNILKTNSTTKDEWLTNINAKSIDVVKRLIKELDTKYVKQEDEAKKKRKMPNNNNLNDIFMMKNAQGNYGAGEGEYEVLPDINDLLN